MEGKWLKKNSVLFKWIISYLFIVFIVISGSVISFGSANSALRDELNNNARALLKQASTSIDAGIEQTQLSLIRAGRSATVAKLLNHSGQICVPQRISMIELKKELDNYVIYNSMISNLFVYFPQYDYIVSNSTVVTDERYFNMYYRQDREGHEAWLGKLCGNTKMGMVVLPSINSSQIMAVYPLIISDSLSSRCYLVGVMDEKQLITIIHNAIPNNTGAVCIADDEGRIVYATEETFVGAFSSQEVKRLSNSEILQINLDGETRIAVGQKSAVTGWTYLSISPESVYLFRQHYVVRIAITSILAVLLIAVSMIIIISRRNYIPVKEMMSMLRKSTAAHQLDYDELAYITQNLNELLEENQSLEKRLANQSRAVQSGFIRSLLKGRLNNNGHWHNEAILNEVDLTCSQYYVVVIEDKGQTNTVEQEIIECCNQFAGDLRVYVTQIDSFFACIVLQEKEVTDFINGYVESVRSSLERHGVPCRISFSASHESTEMISVAYDEALEAMSYRMVLPHDSILDYQKVVCNSHDGYWYPLDQEQQLTGSMLSGNITDASHILTKIFDVNNNEKVLSPDMAHALLVNLLSTCMRTCNQLFREYHKEVNISTQWIVQLNECDSLADGEQLLMSVVDIICNYVVTRQQNQNKDFSDEVCMYIRDHLTDMNLSVDEICHYFHKSRSYMGKVVLDNTGLTMHQMINKLRMDRVKELLKKTHFSVNEIAEMSGYVSNVTMIRIFRKETGMTPTQFRALSKNNNQQTDNQNTN